MKLLLKSMLVRLLGRRLFNALKYSVVKKSRSRGGIFYDLELLQYVQVDLGLSL